MKISMLGDKKIIKYIEILLKYILKDFLHFRQDLRTSILIRLSNFISSYKEFPNKISNPLGWFMYRLLEHNKLAQLPLQNIHNI